MSNPAQTTRQDAQHRDLDTLDVSEHPWRQLRTIWEERLG